MGHYEHLSRKKEQEQEKARQLQEDVAAFEKARKDGAGLKRAADAAVPLLQPLEKAAKVERTNKPAARFKVKRKTDDDEPAPAESENDSENEAPKPIAPAGGMGLGTTTAIRVSESHT